LKLVRGAQAKEVARRAQRLTELKAARLDTLLTMRGVVEAVEAEESEQAQASLAEALLAGLGVALAQLVGVRAAEGARLQRVIEKQLATIGSLIDRATKAAARRPDSIAARLGEQVARLIARRQGRHSGGARPPVRPSRGRQRAYCQRSAGGT
jgi:uncharacterized protein YicC (UPF0701 family)